MRQNLQMPLLLPTLAFIVGCLLFGALESKIWTPLIMLLIGGALFIWRGWSVSLLFAIVAIGGVRMSLYDTSDREPAQTEIHLLTEINHAAQDRVAALGLSSRAEGLVRAMVLGDRGAITSKQRGEYGHGGASHILALSGLHISIVFVFINLLLLPLVLLPRGHIVRNILVVMLIWAYAGVVGMSPSVVRGAVMFSVLQMAWVWGQPYSAMNALLFTLLAVVAVDPSMLYSVGFQLSVLSVAAIFLWALPLYYRLFEGGGFVVSTLCIAVACSVATMPIVSHVFGYVPLLGVLMSPLYILCSVVIIWLGVVWIVAPMGALSAVFRFGVEVAAMLQDRGAEWVASQGWGVLFWRATLFEVWTIYLIYIVVTLLVWGNNDEN